MRLRHTTCVAALTSLVCLAIVQRAFADSGPSTTRARAQSSANAQQTLRGAANGRHAPEPSADSLTAFVRSGLTDAQLDRVLDQLVASPRADALPLLHELAGHRRAAARRQAVAALSALAAAHAPSRSSVLVAFDRGLRDSDARVRAASARALGAHGNAEHGALLARALERGVPEAAAALGRVGHESLLERVHAQLGVQPLATMLDGYDAWLARGDLSEQAKLEIVARLGEVAVPAVKAFLRRLIAERRFERAPALQHAVVATERRIASVPEARPKPSPAPTAPARAPAAEPAGRPEAP